MLNPQKSKKKRQKRRERKKSEAYHNQKENKQEKWRKVYLKKGKCRKLNHAMHWLREELQRKVGEENSQSNDWQFGKSERESEKRRSLKTKAQKTEIQRETQESYKLEH